MTTVKLCNWYVSDIYANDPYKAPEQRQPCLVGEVYGHPNPRHEDGKLVRTTAIQKTEGRWVQTRNTIYELDGPPAPGYQKYCDDNSITIDPDAPVKLLQA